MKIDSSNECLKNSFETTADDVKISAFTDIENGDTISLKKGEYHFYKDYSEHKIYHMTNTDSFAVPEKYFAVLIEDKENITIDGNGSVFVIHGDMCALSLIRCKNITLKNFTIRCNSPTNYEMTVMEKNDNTIKYSIPEKSSFYLENNNIIFYEQSPFSNKNYYEYKNNEECHCNVIHNGDNVYRTDISPVKDAVKIERVGEHEVLCTYEKVPALELGTTITMSRNFCRDNCGLFFWECSNVVSENIAVNYMHGFGWLSQMCENLTFDKINFEPAQGYHVSSFADCIHVCGCKGYVKINECFFSHSHDDGINIHGAFLRLKDIVDDNIAVFEFVHNQQGGYSAFFKGDKIKFYSRRDLSEVDGLYTVENAVDDINHKTVRVTFKEKLPEMQSQLFVCENVTYNPDVIISNCTFRAIPTRGILCTTNKPADIYGNKFINVLMADIYISCDCREWYESGPCKNMKIHNNIFSKENAVLLEPLCIDTPVANVHENIEIYDNIIPSK